MSHSFSADGALHVAIIMDGNGRWARERGRPRTFGHRAGAQQVRKITEAAPDLGVGTLTLYAFSSDNWQRPGPEVSALMRLFRAYLAAETERCIANGIRLGIIGRRDRLATPLRLAIDAAEAATADGDRMYMRIALDYSARDGIVHAAAHIDSVEPTRGEFAQALAHAVHESEPVSDVDLLIRTGGEQRLSDFLLWEAAYAELYFTPRMWPDFGPTDLAAAIRDFRGRERRFGRVLEAAAG